MTEELHLKAFAAVLKEHNVSSIEECAKVETDLPELQSTEPVLRGVIELCRQGAIELFHLDNKNFKVAAYLGRIDHRISIDFHKGVRRYFIDNPNYSYLGLEDETLRPAAATIDRRYAYMAVFLYHVYGFMTTL